jgi:hypothetical protein
MKIYGILISCFLLITYSNRKSNCEYEVRSLDGKIRHVQGCFRDSLEEGKFVVYDAAKRIIESGDYNRGVKTGEWIYPEEMEGSRTVVWSEFSSSRLRLRTNISENLKITDHEDHLVKFVSTDTLKKLSLVLAIYDLARNNINIDTFYLKGVQDLKNSGVSFDLVRNKVHTDKKICYMDWYRITRENENLEALSFYGYIEPTKIAEITVFFNERSKNFATVLFESVIPNFFVEDHRFIGAFEPILSVERL